MPLLTLRGSPTIPTSSFRFGKRHIKMFSRHSVQEIKTSATQASRKISSASPNAPLQTQEGWDVAWDSLGAGLVSGMRCGPPESISRNINMAAENLSGCSREAQQTDGNRSNNFDKSGFNPPSLPPCQRHPERQTEKRGQRETERKRHRQRQRETETESERDTERGRQRDTEQDSRTVVCWLGHTSGLRGHCR